MPCDLSKDELDMLFYLVDGRCVSERHTISVKAIEGNLGSKMNVEKVLKSLSNEGYVGIKKKKDPHYWAVAGKCIGILRSHGYDVPYGREHKI